MEKLPAGAIEIALEEGEIIKGRVIDTAGHPVEGATVACTESNDTTDEQGRFALGGLSGETTVNVTPPADEGWVRPKSRKAKPGEPLDIEIEEGLTISGTVSDEAGKVPANVQVSGSWSGGRGAPSGNVQTRPDAAGHFELKGIPGDSKVNLNFWAWSAGNALAPVQKQNVVPGTTDLRIVFAAGAPISGQVMDSDGAPLTSGYVQAQPVGGGNWGWAQISSDGRFEIKNTKPGKYKLRVQDGKTNQSVQLGEYQAPSTGLQLQMPVQVTISGQIDSTKKGFRVAAYRTTKKNTETKWANVKGDGSFTVAVPAGGGAWTLYAYSAGAGEYGFTREVQAGASNVTIGTDEGLNISGRLETADGEPVPNTRVTAQSKTPDPANGSARTDADGRFEIKGLPDGTYNLQGRVRSASGQNRWVRKQDIQAGATGVVLK